MSAHLQSHLAGRWQSGTGAGATLVNPATEEPLARASSAGLDLSAALAHARQVGGPALRALSFRQRAGLLAKMAATIHAAREELIEIGVRNAGNTRGDAKFDVDGATATLTAYAQLGETLPDDTVLADGPGLALGRTPRFWGQHVWTSRRGVAVHVNAFNFPAWGMLEKTACALLAGMPVLEKPGTPTAMLAERIAHLLVEAAILPAGAFSFLAGSAGNLFDHLGPQDVVAFTGSSATAATLRRHAAFVERGARLNVEADSLNAMLLLPDATPDGEAFALCVRDLVREITQKAGQKCTATRRVLVPAALVDAFVEDVAAQLRGIAVGDPAEPGTRMGPLTTAGQLAEVREGLERLAAVGRVACGGPQELRERGYFVAPTLLVAREAETLAAGSPVHALEVFGPVATVLPWSGEVEDASRAIALGQGSLVTSIYGDDRAQAVALARELAPFTGRLYLGGSKLGDAGTGPGLVLPQLVHGGPGRAGGGEELGGLRGVLFGMQRTAVAGFKSAVEAVAPTAHL